MSKISYEVNVDTGGTFTDCIAYDTRGRTLKRKVLSNSTLRGRILEWLDSRTIKIKENWELEKDILPDFEFKILNQDHPVIKIHSYNICNQILTLHNPIPENLVGLHTTFEITSNEEAPILGTRLITQTRLGEPLPKIKMKLGSTKGTNALLENKGAEIVFFVTKGYKDILAIGTQQRPDIFAINVVKPSPLCRHIIEVEERVDALGNIIKPIKTTSLKTKALDVLNRGIETAAIAFMNAYKNPEHELELKHFLLELGFKSISVSSELSSLIKFLQRAETTVVNACLLPVICFYLQNVTGKLKEGSFHIMTSAGGLMRYQEFQPKESLLSGPAGGVVGAVTIGIQSGYNHLITFDMGGTSTDVARFGNEYEYKFELEIGNAHIFSPALAIETVAAGGGSICHFDGYKLCVGPDSAGAFPGPACYGAGGPLTITDVNLLLGRLDTGQFGIPVSVSDSERRLTELIREIEQKAGQKRTMEEVLQGFLQIANEVMAGAIKKISLSKGYDPRQYTLVAFGGAGGLHATAIAELLNMKIVLIPKDAGLLSAYGIANAKVERFSEIQLLKSFDKVSGNLIDTFNELEKNAVEKVIKEGFKKDEIEIRKRMAYLRFKGQDTGLEVPFTSKIQVLTDFRDKYESIYGHWSDHTEIEVESLRVIASTIKEQVVEKKPSVKTYQPAPSHFIRSYSKGQWLDIPVFIRKKLDIGAEIKGFALILDEHSTAVVDDGWKMQIDPLNTAILTRIVPFKIESSEKKPAEDQTQEVELELFTNRFMSIAENMGTMLQRTSLSVNVKERLDFSCAVLNARGELVANAPHIPVHLGSLGVCVRALTESFPMKPGDTVVTNHPGYGGSHLPDLTLVTPVYTEFEQLIGYVVNRAHHAEIGGKVPASMPPDAQNLAEEGVIIKPFYLVWNRIVDWEGMREILEKSPFPSRSVKDNLADLNAALAANRNGELALQKLVKDFGFKNIQSYMDLLKEHASRKMADTLSEIPNGIYKGEEFLDDGTALRVSIMVEDRSCTFDFSGTDPVHHGNMNATVAIVNGVVIYVLRLLIRDTIPLNDGILEPVKLIIPECLLNPGFPDDPLKCPAIVGGNVEVSQRLTDTLIKAFGISACSQGTMNNVMFGNDRFSYYETICGGCGAGREFNGASAVHHHMTNTRMTDPEIIEHRYPVRVDRFEIRKDSGGEGQFNGGNGVIREFTFTEPVSLSVLTQHRKEVPFGLDGGKSGKPGEQYVIKPDGTKKELESIDGFEIETGDKFVIKTPGGGGYGRIKD
ncbi:MAG: hydantoinase B/oxoprolinase family protein [Bacteroidales bacterium]|nr:hydantoinase B/oxoprolinase family protein [Bacteroidales bacterium]